jgi:FkbM family methyltransferase
MLNTKQKENFKNILFKYIDARLYYKSRLKINSLLEKIGDLSRKVVYRLVKPPITYNTYSQCGEDVIVSYLLSSLGIKKPTYLDIGTCHPIAANNTYLLYTQGHRGVCIEANPTLMPEIQKARSGDICLNVGIGIDEKAELDFYIFSNPVVSTCNIWISTFSNEEAEKRKQHYKLHDIVKVSQTTINCIIRKYFDKHPNFVSIDVEGLDIEILKSLDFNQYRPEIFCVETVSFSENSVKEKETEIINFMNEQGYLLYGDTYLNSIFVDKSVFTSKV